MSNVLNKVILIGHLGHDPEIRYTSSGIKVARFSLATSEVWHCEEEKHVHTEWHKIVAWRNLAEIVNDYLSSGSKIFLEGRLRTKRWYDSDGIQRNKTEISMDKMLMLDPPPDDKELVNGEFKDEEEMQI